MSLLPDDVLRVELPVHAAIAANRAVSNMKDHLIQTDPDNHPLIRSLIMANGALANALLNETTISPSEDGPET